MAKSYYDNYDFLLLFVVLLIIGSCYLLWYYDDFTKLSIVFFMLVIVSVILFKYNDE